MSQQSSPQNSLNPRDGELPDLLAKWRSHQPAGLKKLSDLPDCLEVQHKDGVRWGILYVHLMMVHFTPTVVTAFFSRGRVKISGRNLKGIYEGLRERSLPSIRELKDSEEQTLPEENEAVMQIEVDSD